MSKGHTTSNAVVNGGSRQTQMHMHHLSQDKKREMWAEMVRHKEEAKKMSQEHPLEKYYKGNTYLIARGLSTLYVVMRKYKTSNANIQREFGMKSQTLSRYRRWARGLPYSGTRVSSFITKREKEIKAAIKASPVPTPKEIERLMKLANPNTTNHPRSGTRPANNSKTVTRPEIIMNQAQINSEIPMVDFNFEEKHLSKSDVVVAVIVGALVGASMAAYLFITNGAI